MSDPSDPRDHARLAFDTAHWKEARELAQKRIGSKTWAQWAGGRRDAETLHELTRMWDECGKRPQR